MGGKKITVQRKTSILSQEERGLTRGTARFYWLRSS